MRPYGLLGRHKPTNYILFYLCPAISLTPMQAKEILTFEHHKCAVDLCYVGPHQNPRSRISCTLFYIKHFASFVTGYTKLPLSKLPILHYFICSFALITFHISKLFSKFKEKMSIQTVHSFVCFQIYFNDQIFC